jgi:hypothetical protein
MYKEALMFSIKLTSNLPADLYSYFLPCQHYYLYMSDYAASLQEQKRLIWLDSIGIQPYSLINPNQLKIYWPNLLGDNKHDESLRFVDYFLIYLMIIQNKRLAKRRSQSLSWKRTMVGKKKWLTISAISDLPGKKEYISLRSLAFWCTKMAI